MKVKHPLHHALHSLGRHVQKDHSKRGEHCQTGEPGQDAIRERLKFFHGYSRTTCAKINHPVTTKITSKARSTRNHTPDQSAPARSAPVTFTAAMSKGTSNGSSISGNKTSRARVRTAMAANRVPRAEKPTMPKSRTNGNANKDHENRAPKSSRVSGVTTACTRTRKSTFPSSLARNRVPGSNGHSSRPKRHPRSCSIRNARCKLSMPANSNATHSRAAPTSGRWACSGLRAKTNTKTMSSARTKSEDTRSLVRSSRRTSFQSRAHISEESLASRV